VGGLCLRLDRRGAGRLGADQEALDVQVLVEVGPVQRVAEGQDLPVVALRQGGAQSRRGITTAVPRSRARPEGGRTCAARQSARRRFDPRSQPDPAPPLSSSGLTQGPNLPPSGRDCRADCRRETAENNETWVLESSPTATGWEFAPAYGHPSPRSPIAPGITYGSASQRPEAAIDRKSQIFVSSTYEALREERNEVIKA
jgi:hypothetical protein